MYQHGEYILNRLEYYGDGQTGNHLINNGRGLFLSGLFLDHEEWIEVGAEILVKEAQRAFGPSGILREGSSHYHLLVTKWFLECWLEALSRDRQEASLLEKTSSSALAAAKLLQLSGNSLIGMFPDCSPKSLFGL